MQDAEPWWQSQGYPADPYTGGLMILAAAGVAVASTELSWWWDGTYSPELVLLAPGALTLGVMVLLSPVLYANCPRGLRANWRTEVRGDGAGSPVGRRVRILLLQLLLVVWTLGVAEGYCRGRLGSTLFPWLG